MPLFALAMAQRPTYAGSGPIGRPELASRFRDPNEVSTVAVNNRLGEDGSTEKIPVDARGDYDLVKRLEQWPREHRPFWLLNAEAIEAARSRNLLLEQAQQQQNSNGVRTETRFGQSETIPIRPAQPRSSFLGNRNR